jgi:hypothetical protein
MSLKGRIAPSKCGGVSHFLPKDEVDTWYNTFILAPIPGILPDCCYSKKVILSGSGAFGGVVVFLLLLLPNHPKKIRQHEVPVPVPVRPPDPEFSTNLRSGLEP